MDVKGFRVTASTPDIKRFNRYKQKLRDHSDFKWNLDWSRNFFYKKGVSVHGYVHKNGTRKKEA